MKKLALVSSCLSIFFISCEKMSNKNLTGDPRDNIVNTWICRENRSNGVTSAYIVVITKSETQNDLIYLDNLYNLGKNINATIAGLSLDIPIQYVSGWTIYGSGSIASDYSKITLSFIASDGSGTITDVTAILTEYPSY
jgi:hypothetical protein